MIEIEIPKDIRKYKNKVIGPFSAREAFGVAIAAVSAFVVYRSLHGVPTDVKGFLSMAAMLPGIGFGFVKYYGLNFERLIATVFVDTFIIPKKLLYKTQNIFDSNIKSPPPKKKYVNVTKNPDFEKYI